MGDAILGGLYGGGVVGVEDSAAVLAPSGATVAAQSVILNNPKDWPNLDQWERWKPLPQAEFGDAFREDWPEPRRAPQCERSWRVMACSCKATVYESGCNKRSCRSCEKHLRLRRALAIRDRFESVRAGRPVIYTIFTVPISHRAKAADPKTWARWRRAIWKWLKKNCGGLFAVERTDPAGDTDPSRWHPHMNFLWMQRDGFRPFLDVEKLGAAWAAVIAADVVNCWTAYSSNKGKLWHWYSYMGRTWPDWVDALKEAHKRVNWFGSYPKKKPKETTCQNCGDSYVFVKCGPKEDAESLAAAGPEAVKWEAQKREMAMALSRARPVE